MKRCPIFPLTLSKILYALVLPCAACVHSAFSLEVTTLQDNVPGSLRAQINSSVSGDTITFASGLTGTMLLNNALPLYIDKSLTIAGNSGITIDGQSTDMIFYVRSGNVSISDLALQNGLSKGGNGGGAGGAGGGGALGAGGGIFVDNAAAVSISNVSFSNNLAIGGNGAAKIAGGPGGGGGGGFNQGTGGNNTIGADGCGGGGFGGAGGSCQSSGGGGGGSLGFSGANANQGGAGAGGAGAGGDGGSPTVDGGLGGAGGTFGGTPGAGGVSSASGAGGDGGNGTGGAGGGGGGFSNNNTLAGKGGDGGPSAGGGGGGGTAFSGGVGAIGGAGGNGSFASGGGGGGGGTDVAGNGGSAGDFGGGGGGGGGGVADGGAGGFGGGGGGAGSGGFTGGTGGAGGFGAGNGGSASPASITQGGGGSGFGGAVFVRQGGSLTMVNGGFTTNAVQNGTGSTSGLQNGKDVFLMQGSQMTISTDSSVTMVADIAGFDPSNSANLGGSLIKNGAGTLTLTTTLPPPPSFSTAYNGNITINAGTLNLSGTTGSAVAVNSGSILTGTGTAGSVVNSGTVAPGIGIGTFHITDNYTQNANGILEIEITGTGATDLLQIGGAASISGTLQVDPQPGGYLAGTTYTFLTAPGGVSGTFAQITGLGRLQAKLNQFPTFLQLEILQTVIGAVTLHENPGIVQRYLERIPIVPGSDLANVVFDLNTLTTPQLIDALRRISPAQFGGLNWAIAQLSARVNSQLASRSDPLCFCELPACFQKNDNGIWVEGLYDYLHQGSIQQLQGFNASSAGVIAGGERHLGKNILFGVTGGYSNTSFDWSDHYGNSQISTKYLGIYAAYCCGLMKFQASLLGGFQRYSNNRTIIFPGINRTARSRNRGKSIAVHVGSERKILWRKNYELTPFIAVDYFHVRQNIFAESGAASLNLDVEKSRNVFLRTELGLAFSRAFCLQWGTVVPKAKLSWVTWDPISSGRITANLVGFEDTFTVNTATTCLMLASPVLEVSLWMNNGLTIGCSYEGEYSRWICDQEVKATVSWTF